jgi:hypothetical protein
MLNKVRAALPPPAVFLAIAMCMGFYIATPDEGRQRQVYTTGRKAPAAGPAAAPAPSPQAAAPRANSSVDNFLLAGFSAVADSGPLPLAGATAIPLVALLVRRRLAL